ncbi:MAG: pyridoxamine 5'-phosphate oxidase family protein [Acidimicrobiales bacterium]|jgi:nitroimidazol reductase NimA-like FMN-containing flavoprotein (pyridoxamine 5'-phosphate oxidase superfamily)
MDPSEYPQTKSNVPSRHSERARYDGETVHSILDGGVIAHVGFVADGQPQVLPMLYVRVGTAVYLHGSTGSHLNRMAARNGGVAVAVEVTLMDEFVLARSTFSHSVNYRSVVAAGEAVIVASEERKAEVLEALVERLIPGRSGDARRPTSDELRQTGVLELQLADVSAKVRTGDPIDKAEDLDSRCWAGVLPIGVYRGEPRPAADLAAGIEVPAYLAPGAPSPGLV